MEEETDVLIVGGGWAGVSAALALNKHNQENPNARVDFLLLEGHADRLGGRAFSFPHCWTQEGQAQTTYFEHGAQYIGRDQRTIWNLVQSAIADGLISENDLVDGFAARFPYKTQVMRVAGRRYEYDRADCLFGIGGVPPDLGLWDLIGSLLFIESVSIFEKLINVLEPWNSPSFVTELDRMTMAEWIASFGLAPGAESLMRVSVEAVLSVECDQISAFYFLWYCACNGGFLNEVNDENGGPQQYYLKSGMSQLVSVLANPIRDRIRFGSIVEGVQNGDQRVTVRTSSGTISAKRVVFAASPASVQKVQFDPALPESWQAITAQQMGTTIKCVVFYRTPWWRNIPEQADPKNEGVPQFTGYCGASDYPVTWVMDYSPTGPAPTYDDEGCFALMTFTIGKQAEALGPTPSEEEVVQLVTKGIAELMDDERALWTSDEYLGISRYEWKKSDKLIPGGPNTVFMPGVLTGPNAPARAFDKPVGRVHFACAELARTPTDARQTRSPYFVPNLADFGETGTYSDYRENLGYMDGAIISGRFVAQQVLEALGVVEASETQPATLDPQQSELDRALDEQGASLQELVGAAPKALPKLSEEQVINVLTTLCKKLYSGSALDIDGWRKRAWASNPAGLQNWVTDVLAEALVENGLLDAPPEKPTDPGIIELVIYMLRMVVWGNEFQAAATAFAQTGYAAYSSFKPETDPYKPQKTSDVVMLTRLANSLMQLKSTEPFTEE